MYSTLEKKIIQQWREDKTFQKQLDKNKNEEKYVFYDGPPFATGLPHYGHLVASTIKDIVPRYWAMSGYNVPRKWGWDCIAEGTLVNLADGTSIPIEKFDFLAFVETLSIETEEYLRQNKKLFFNKGVKKTIELEFDNGNKLKCTDDHQIYTKLGWKKAIELDENDEIFASRINPEFEFKQSSWENYLDHILLSSENIISGRKSGAYCRIIGYMLGSGNYFVDEKDVIEFVNDVHLVFKENLSYSYNERYTVNLSNHLRYLENYKFIPRLFFYDSTPNFLKKEFFAGLFGGYRGNYLWEGEKDLNDILYVLSNLGIFVKVEGDKIFLGEEDVGNYKLKMGYRYAERKREKPSKVKMIGRTEIGYMRVYDLSINETHNFIANGIVVHNCHGLPIEFEIEKKLGIKTKEEIMKIGIGKYNDACRNIVMKYSKDWKKTIERLGRWVDMDNDYKTMDLSYMNTVWKVFYALWEKELIYQGVKVMPYSTSCTTPLSNFEAKLDYKKIQDPSIVVKFMMKYCEILTYFLVWTTTPWTLPSNLALCVNPDLDYVVCEKDNSFYILLEKFMDKYGFVEVVARMKGDELIGLEYEPLFDFYDDRKGFFIVGDKYVSDDSGTGIVHQAPAFGEDDYRVCLKNGIIDKTISPPCPFDANGYFTNEVPVLKGLYFKDADKVVLKLLKDKLFHQTSEHHDYPHCWRSGSPLMYRAVPCTFVNVEKIRDEIVKVNSQETNWVPEHIKEGRFGNWLKEAKDWCVSRNRYWGTPIPLWKSDDGDVICIKDVEELEEIVGRKINDIHRNHIDSITIERNGKIYKRIEEVFDCWFESGSVPFASDNFPADFIAEGLDQTRGWFYTLMVLSVALKGHSPYKNVIVNGLVLAEDGEKMSKSKKNFPDPELILEKYGADALRLYLISQGIVRGDSLKFKEEGVKMIIQNVHIFAHNTLNFLKQMIPLYEQKYCLRFHYFNLDELKDRCSNILDQMLLNYLQEFVDAIHKEMQNYNLGNIVGRIDKFIGQLSRTYLNMNKSRLKSMKSQEEALNSLNVLFYVFKKFSIMIAPFAPFMAEYFYQELRLLEGEIDFQSVHLENLPVVVWEKSESGQEGINLLELIIEARGEMRNILKSSKKPIRRQIIYVNDWRLIPFLEGIMETLMIECNVMEFEFSSRLSEVVVPQYEYSMQLLGKRFKGDAKNVKLELEKYFKDKKVERGKKKVIINGKEEIFDEEIKVVGKLDQSKIWKFHQQYYVDSGVLILSDLCWDDEMQEIYIMKKITRELMNLRKILGMVPTDSAKVFFINEADSDFVEKNLWKLYEGTGMSFEEGSMDESKTIIDFEDENIKYKFMIQKI